MHDMISPTCEHTSADIRPVEILASGYRLFGCFHPPRTGSECGRSVLICHPAGHEYIRCYRALKQLTLQLAAAGFGVMRFDYFGCGDSEGEHKQAGVQQWIIDIHTAGRTLAALSEQQPCTVIGIRLGATFAAMAAMHGPPPLQMVLWDPVLRGEEWFNQVRPQHAAQLKRFGDPGRINDNGIGDGRTEEIMGFDFTSGLIDDIQAIDLVHEINAPPASQVLLLDTADEAGPSALKPHLEQRGTRLAYRQLSDSRIWLAEPFEAVVPRQAIAAIVQWMKETNR